MRDGALGAGVSLRRHHRATRTPSGGRPTGQDDQQADRRYEQFVDESFGIAPIVADDGTPRGPKSGFASGTSRTKSAATKADIETTTVP